MLPGLGLGRQPRPEIRQELIRLAGPAQRVAQFGIRRPHLVPGHGLHAAPGQHAGKQVVSHVPETGNAPQARIGVYGHVVVHRGALEGMNVGAGQDLRVPQRNAGQDEQSRGAPEQAAPVRGASLLGPAGAEDVGIDAVAHHQAATVRHAHETGNPQQIVHGRIRVQDDRAARVNFPVKAQGRQDQSPPASQSLPNAAEIRLGIEGIATEEALGDQRVHVGIADHPAAGPGRCARDLLGQKRLSTGPVENPVEHPVRFARRQAQPATERPGLFEREVIEFHSPADIEQGPFRRQHPFPRRGRAHQRKGETLVVRLGRASVVARTDTGKEIRREGQLVHFVQAVQEDHHRTRGGAEYDLPEKLGQALAGAQRHVFLPPLLKIDLQTQVANDPVGDSVIPAARLGHVIAAAKLRQIHNCGRQAR